MAIESRLRTRRLLLRRWKESDREAFAAINADREVMEHFPATLARDQSDALIARIEGGFNRYGYGLWALELPEREPLIGFTGLMAVEIAVAFAPAVEVGWRLARPYWGHGFASEAAAAAVAFGFERYGLDEIVAYTAAGNARSRRVMERLGMQRDPADDFDHPLLARGDSLSRHVLYRLPRERWSSATIAGSGGS